MNVIALKEKAEGILEKEVEDTTWDDAVWAMRYVLYQDTSSLFLDPPLHARIVAIPLVDQFSDGFAPFFKPFD